MKSFILSKLVGVSTPSVRQYVPDFDPAATAKGGKEQRQSLL
jgi:hypothetical protein